MTGELEKYRAEAIEKLASAGISVDKEKELQYGLQLKLSSGGGRCAVNLYHSRKKGRSAVPSGGDRGLLDRALAALSGEDAGELWLKGVRLGTDEAGKGDYFGPLVAAGVCCGEDRCRRLVSMGVADSKKLSRNEIQRLYQEVTVMDGIHLAVCSIGPAEYNRMFASLNAVGRNSLDMQARAHGRVIEELLGQGCDPGNIVIDRFCEMPRLKPWLPETAARIHLTVRAEDREPAVAAASIIARSVYLAELERLSRRFEVKLAPGAGASVDRTGAALVQRHGQAALAETAKIHFSNTLRITSGT